MRHWNRWKATITASVVFLALMAIPVPILIFSGNGQLVWMILLPFFLLLAWACVLDRSYPVELCQAPHPEDPEILCDRRRPCFGRHSNAFRQVSWPGVQPPKRGPQHRKEVVEIALRARRRKK